MDVPLYALALVSFVVLYLALSIFLAWSIIICLLIIISYLALRYGDLVKSYPFSLSDSITTITFIGITWAIFVFLGQKTPIPIVGNGLTYASLEPTYVSATITISIVLSFLFLIVGGAMLQHRSRASNETPTQ
jgi:hypothetical protein